MARRNLEAIREVLRRTKESSEFTPINTEEHDVLEYIGVSLSAETPIIIDRTHRIDLAKVAIQNGASIAEIVELLTWKDFEGFVASILAANSFYCVESFRRKGNSKMHGMEIDVIGARGGTVIAIDAKMWGIRSGKASALKRAAEKQKVRTRELSKELDRLSKKMNRLSPREYLLHPVLVTWLVEEVELHEGVPVVPVFKLNSFILDFDNYEDLIVGFSGHFKTESD